MFILILVLIITQHQLVNTLKCMMKDKTTHWHIATSSSCTFQLKFDDPFPDTAVLKSKHGCEQEQPALISSFFSTNDFSCFASITLDYRAQTMALKFDGVQLAAKMDPYDHMLALYTNINHVTQYKITGNFDQKAVELVVRIQCKTNDDCATEILRDLLPKILQPNKQLEIFENINQLLNGISTSELHIATCIDKNNQDENCFGPSGCEIKFHDTILHDRSCWIFKNILGASPSIVYRFNVKNDDPIDIDFTDKATKYSYQCRKDRCNSDEIKDKVDQLIKDFVDPSNLPTETTMETTETTETSTSDSSIVTTDQPRPHHQKGRPSRAYHLDLSSFVYFLSLSIVFLFIS